MALHLSRCVFVFIQLIFPFSIVYIFCSVKNSLSPAWTTTFLTSYTFGQETKFNVGIFDDVGRKKKPKSMGSALFEIGEILGARGNIKAKKLKNGGTLFVRVTKAADINYGTLHLTLRGHKLKNVDGFFSKSDPFYVVSAQTNSAGGATWQPVYRSKVKDNDLNPKWEEATISVEKVCDGDKSKPILIEVYDWEKSGKHQPMGKIETSINGLIRAQSMPGSSSGKEAPLTGAMDLRHKGRSYGQIVVVNAHITGEDLTPQQSSLASHVASSSAASFGAATPDFSSALDGPPIGSAKDHVSVPTSAPPPLRPIPPPMAPPKFGPGNKPKFVDYLSGGCEINLAIAIDFTGSNGDPRRPGTLHYIHPDGQLNDYEKALTAVGSIVARYDSDQMFPVFGFGAKYGGVIQHCFQVGPAAELKGVQGVLEGYRSTFRSGLVMSGPTVFSEVIAVAASQARSKQEINASIGQQSYTILLILTDGAVTDIEQTKHAIRSASTAPLSIVIVGVGNADFSAMQFLDDFQQQEGGRTRDIVQFVEFNRHRHSRQNLTRETLDEIPDQLVGYFYGNNIMPLPPIQGSLRSVFEEDYNADEDIDLNVQVSEEGEISLENEQQAYYDGQTYGTIHSFLPPPMAPPSTNLASAPPGSPAYPTHGTMPQAGLPAAAPVIVPSVVHIQTPPNSYPGMQLQVQNPTTGQFQIVTVPEGVPPGGTFAVGL